MGVLYAKDAKFFCNDYIEIYVPKAYFEDGMAENNGDSIETFGVVYLRAYPNGSEGKLNVMKIPVTINLMVYEYRDDCINAKGRSIDVITLKYPKDSYVMRQSVTKGREVAENFMNMVLNGKLPHTLNYVDLIELWWKNLEMSGVNFKVPSKMYEMILSVIYRNPDNKKKRFGQLYGSQTNPSGYGYATSNVRSVVRDQSTFGGMVFEDMGTMISNGINNAESNFEEPTSPLEKIIHY